MHRQPLKICFIAPKAYPLFDPGINATFGGAEVDLYQLACQLSLDNNFHISFITADYGQPTTQTINNITIIKSLKLNACSLTGAYKIWRSLYQANANIYIIKTASPGVPLVAAFCRLNKKVFVYRTAHLRECNGSYIRKHFILGKLFKWALRQAKIVLVQNQQDIPLLKQSIGIDSTPIPNAHKLPNIPIKPNNTLPPNIKNNTVLWVGRSKKVKRPHIFLELANSFPDYKFVMICSKATGDNNYNQLYQKAKEIPNLEFHQQVAFREIDQYFRSASIFINTSTAEGFPNTFIQACAAATAILSLNVNPDDFLAKYNCGFYCQNNIDILKEKLQYLLNHPQHLHKLSSNARKYAEEHHDITKIIEQYKSLFTGITQRHT